MASSESFLEKFGKKNCKAVATPIVKSTKDEASKEQDNSLSFPYRQFMRALAYLLTGTRPYIVYGVSVVSRNPDNPSSEDEQTVKRISKVTFIKGTLEKGIVYSKQ